LCAIFLVVICLLYVLSLATRKSGDSAASLMAEKLSANTPPPVPVFVSDRFGNFEPAREEPRDGPGEGGKPHYPSPDKMNEAQRTAAEYGMTMTVSDEIAMDRAIPDTRNPECKHWDYPGDLPKASVIIVFHNEGTS
jgi:polypeptide N-acetylgalactosaminyltransferase